MDAGEKIQPEAVAEVFGKVMRRHRHRHGLSQEKLAEAIDVDRTYVSMLERGIHQPSLTVVLRVAEAFEMRPGALIEEVRKERVPEQEE
jgi:transcriptional regulator with XRE-family HTH domain